MSSMIYTVGTALGFAHDNGMSVTLLVEGQWLDGTVVMYDGHGVVIDNGLEHAVVRLEAISAVRMLPIPAEPGPQDRHDPRSTPRHDASPALS